MEQVISDLDLDMTAEQLKGSVSINNPTDTRILEITVNNTDSKMAKKIVERLRMFLHPILAIKWKLFRQRLLKLVRLLL